MPAKRKASRMSPKSRPSAKKSTAKSVSTNGRMKNVRLPRKLTTAKTHPEGDLTKHLGLMKRPFMQGIAQPKIPDGEVNTSLGERLRTTGQIVCKSESYILLFPGLGSCISIGNGSVNDVSADNSFGAKSLIERQQILKQEAYDFYVSTFPELELTDTELRTMFEHLVNTKLYNIDEQFLYQKYVESFPNISVTFSDLEKVYDMKKADGDITDASITDWIGRSFSNVNQSHPKAAAVRGWLGDDYFINLGREPKSFNDWFPDQDIMKLGFDVYQEDVADRRREQLFPNENESLYLKELSKVPRSYDEEVYWCSPEILGYAEPKVVSIEANIFHKNHDFGWKLMRNTPASGESDQYWFGHFDTDQSSGWRIVSQGCRLELVNNDHENDGWFEACRFKARLNPGDIALHRDDGKSGSVLSPDVLGNVKLLPAPNTGFWQHLDDISFNQQKGYISGKLSEIGKHEFSLMRDKTDRSLISREVLAKVQANGDRSHDDAFVTPGASGRLTIVGSTHGSKVLEQLIDRNLDCVLIKIYGRSDQNSPTRLMFDSIQNVEFTLDPSSDVAKYQTPNVAHPNVDEVMDTENNNESASRRK